jgi:hypothetical protein
MGKAKANRKFLAHHTTCCFCGGTQPATEVDHIPSRSCFDERQFPEGFEFPSCNACNSGSSSDEQVVAMFSRVYSHPAVPAKPNEIQKYLKGISNNNPEILSEMSEDIQKISDDTYALHIGENSHEKFLSVLRKWAKAFHYRETGRIVPKGARIYANFWTAANADKIPQFCLYGTVHKLRRSGKNIADQCGYITRNDPNDLSLGTYTFMFRRSFLALMMVDFHGQVVGDELIHPK